MSAVREIREKYKLSQLQLAQYLGVSKSMLAMIEIGRRSLSLAALKKLNVLASSLAKNTVKKRMPPDATASVKELAVLRKGIKKLLGEVNRKVTRLQVKIETMSGSYNAQLLQIGGLQNILTNVAKKDASADKQYLLKLQIDESRDRLRSCNPLQQAVMEIKLQCLQLEAKLLEELLRTPVSKAFGGK